MPTLEWIGKDKVVNHQLVVPYRVLEWKYSFLHEEDSGSETTMNGRITHLSIYDGIFPGNDNY